MIKHIKKHIEGVSQEKINLAIGIVVLIVIIIAIIFLVPIKVGGSLSSDQAKTKITTFINETLLKGQTTANIDEISDAGNVYKLKISVNGQTVESYMTKDGKLFFPQAFNLASSTAESAANSPQKTTAGATKSDKPKVELFVMSYCPYGTQIEKGILPAVQALGNNIDFSLKFVNYAMHGQKELTENTTQYCINKEQSNKFYSYLSCFLKSGDSASCQKTTGVNQTQLSSCVKNTDQQFKVTSQFTNKENWKGDFPPFDINNDDNVKYGVQGSPALVINGAQIESARDSASLLKTICGSFNNQPAICSSAKLSSDSPAPGFGDGTTAGGGAAAAAGCASN